MRTPQQMRLKAKYKAKRKVIDKLVRERRRLNDKIDVVQGKITRLNTEAAELEEAYMAAQSRAGVPLAKQRGL